MKTHPPPGFCDIPNRLLKANLACKHTGTSAALMGLIMASAFSGDRCGVALVTRDELTAYMAGHYSKARLKRGFQRLEDLGLLVKASDPPAVPKKHIP